MCACSAHNISNVNRARTREEFLTLSFFICFLRFPPTSARESRAGPVPAGCPAPGRQRTVRPWDGRLSAGKRARSRKGGSRVAPLDSNSNPCHDEKDTQQASLRKAGKTQFPVIYQVINHLIL